VRTYKCCLCAFETKQQHQRSLFVVRGADVEKCYPRRVWKISCFSWWYFTDLTRWQGWWLWELHSHRQPMCKQCPTMRNTWRKVLNCLKTNAVAPRGCGKFSFAGDPQLTVLVIEKTPVLHRKTLYTIFSKKLLVCRINFWDPRLLTRTCVSRSQVLVWEDYVSC